MAQRELLNSLMGTHRNLGPDEEQKKRSSWRDPTVCKYFLMGFCPYVLFFDTKSDIGSCNKTHEVFHQQMYEREASENTKARYERRFLDLLNDLISKRDYKIAREQERLDLEEEERTKPNIDGTVNTGVADTTQLLVFSEVQKARLGEIDREIDDKNELMEKHGNQGRVDKAKILLAEVEVLKQEKLALHNKAKIQASWSNKNERCLKMCEVCGAYLDRRDSQQRKNNHSDGRVHQGFQKIREKAAQLEEVKKLRKALESGLKEGGEVMEIDGEVSSKKDKDDGDLRASSSKSRSRRLKSTSRRLKSRSRRLKSDRKKRRRYSNSHERSRKRRSRTSSRSRGYRRRRRSRSRSRGRRH